MIAKFPTESGEYQKLVWVVRVEGKQRTLEQLDKDGHKEGLRNSLSRIALEEEIHRE